MTVIDERLGDLHARIPNASIITDPDVTESYRRDWARDPDAGRPLAVVRATSTEDVQAVMRWATVHNIPVVPRGAGSGLSGGATAVDGGIVLTTELMRNIEVNPVTRTAVVQPGLINVEVKRAVAEHGLWYPPDPSSFEMCSIGGNAATNAGGLCCVKYGVTTDYILGLQVVLADGTVVRLGGPRLKDSAGLSLTKLFVGSEGTLGIITEITVRLIPAQAPASTVVGSFATVQDATNAILDITRVMRPAMLEFMDRASIGAVEAGMNMGLDLTAHGMLIAQSDSPGEDRARETEFMAKVFSDNNASDVFTTDDPKEGEAFTAARRFAIPAVERLGNLLLEDVGVPLPALPALIQGIEDISARREVLVAVIAHAGDGNTHPLIVHDPANEDETARANIAFGEIMDLAISLGGTITGEHGVGRLKKAWLPNQVGEDVMELTRRIKSALDPQHILNPGAVI
ncbi:probable glycolate oxidase FAD-linked subunit [Rhodococcus jostii RHA1]|uniref:Glycolate oxidase FAD-linked subunit n=2 Tax=Rhodococcus TaxID=1827 RepID=I0WFM8_RHOOP|nr:MULTISPECIES: FAD-linked oxidase C-terminal domain-containing protein [Rhodococcus]ABG95030.1 probable glycolate oxidase FAD-linked subunit [Rhodococcus jostii RHA1]EID75194.1 glycolate oxidase FAD-linked subunit [Rhodococcus opacus RKJ300 = JCM 13270]QQZ14377.1 FAD-binding protein [Rhodococcus sp. 21391]